MITNMRVGEFEAGLREINSSNPSGLVVFVKDHKNAKGRGASGVYYDDDEKMLLTRYVCK